MDPRQQQQQHPFSRNAASPYGRPSFPPTTAPSQQSPYPSSSNPPSTAPTYSDSQRRPSDPPPYYAQPRPYQPDQPATHSHSRHQSSSSITSAPPINRSMPPPNSPPQGQGGPGAHQIGGSGGTPYGLPPPRGPAAGQSTSFPGGRELPALGSIPRAGSTGSSMSISSMLGGPPPPPSRDSAPPPHYPPHSSAGAPPQASYSPSIHASPRVPPNADYAPFRRPQTPEHAHRIFDNRDSRGSAAPSPQRVYSTPEVQRYGTPQTYSQRGPPLPAAEQRDQARMAGSSNIPRPSSQPKSFTSMPQSRPLELGRPPPGDMYGRRDEEYNPERPPVRALQYEEPRYMSERERQEREFDQRERERRERAMAGGGGGDPANQHSAPPAEYASRIGQGGPAPSYRQPPDPRDRGNWQRQQQQYELSRAPYDPAAPFPRHHDYPTTTAPPYGGHPSYSQPPAERHPPSLPPHHSSAAHSSQQAPPQPYDSPERHRMSALHLSRDQPPPPSHRPRAQEDGAVPPPSVAYGTAAGPAAFEPPRQRGPEDPTQPTTHQRALLQIQEINRRGRISPLPQAVQGAQPQLSGPAGEPGIKSEFGRMFSGIGSGVGAISSPVPAGAQLPYNSAGLARREDSDGTPHDSGADATAKNGRDSARGKRRKPKDEDARDDQDPSGAKRSKPHAHHHHQYVSPGHHEVPRVNSHSHHHHHHHHHPAQDSASSQGNTPLKNAKQPAPGLSPTAPFAKDSSMTHHHQIAPRSNPRPVPARQPSPIPMVIPKPKQIISSKAVLDSVKSLPRHHLGDQLYEPILKPARLQDQRTGRPPRHGYSSTPKPLRWDLIEDKLNCTMTMKIGKQHLSRDSVEEITSRRALWGTDVYTDDSDVIAACIHGGWIRGEWPEGVDIDALSLDEGSGSPGSKDMKGRKANGFREQAGGRSGQLIPHILMEPPKTGPVPVPENRDLHVTLLILPLLEKYASTVRFGIKSREFGGVLAGDDGSHQRAVHDGLSFMVMGIRWVANGAGSQNRLRGKARRERIRRALREVELGPAWAAGVANIDPSGPTVSPKRATDGPAETGSGGGWWKHAEKPPSEGDKENQPVSVEGEPETTKPPVKEAVPEVDMDVNNPEETSKEKAADSNGGSTGTGMKETDSSTLPAAVESSKD